MKKLYLFFVSYILGLQYTFGASKGPDSLFISGQKEILPGNYPANQVVEKIGGTLVTNMIIYVAFFAVIALVISGFMLMIAGGEEEKVKVAKSWVIWSLVGVLLSISAYGIIGFVIKWNISLP